MKTKKIHRAADALREAAGGDVDVAIVLGSGFGAAMRERIDGVTLQYKKIPGMPEPTVAGHAGEAHAGTLAGKRVVAFGGRFHLYEGRDVADVIAPVMIAAHAGARVLVLTNAAGGVNAEFHPGDLMLIGDQLNLTGSSPLLGAELPHGVTERFTDMAEPYSRMLRARARAVAAQHGIALREGVYAGLSGPAYETPAEARYLRTIGADAVGMSTVLETIAARALGRDVVGFSLITNVHGSGAPTTHEEVLDAAARGAENVGRLVEGVVASIATSA